MILIICPNPSVDKFLYINTLSLKKVNKSTEEKTYPGGKGVHVALALNELGMSSKLIGFWGGLTGDWVRNSCETAGVPCYGPNLQQWTRTCLTIKSDSESDDTEIVERGPEVNFDDIESLFDTIENHLKGVSVIAVCGSWPVNSPDNVYIRLKRIAESASIPLWVDTSGERLNQAILSSPFGIHINKAEAAAMFGEEHSTVDYSVKLLDYCKVAAVTAGKNGLFLAYKNTVLHGFCTVDKVISTVGCGDCLLAGLIYSWDQTNNHEDAVITGTACGAANCVRPDLGMLFKEDYNYFKDKVKIKKFESK